MHPLGQKAALLACTREIDPQRETHRWREVDSNYRSKRAQVGQCGPLPPTGKPVRFEEIVILRFVDDRVVANSTAVPTKSPR